MVYKVTENLLFRKLKASGIPIKEDSPLKLFTQGITGSFEPTTDTIYISAAHGLTNENLESTILHELVHYTGKLLNRSTYRAAKEKGCNEEIIAEEESIVYWTMPKLIDFLGLSINQATKESYDYMKQIYKVKPYHKVAPQVEEAFNCVLDILKKSGYVTTFKFR